MGCTEPFEQITRTHFNSGDVIYWVKGSVHVLFWNLLSRGEERGRKGRECKFQDKAHRTLTQEISSALYNRSRLVLLYHWPRIKCICQGLQVKVSNVDSFNLSFVMKIFHIITNGPQVAACQFRGRRWSYLCTGWPMRSETIFWWLWFVNSTMLSVCHANSAGFASAQA